MKNKQYLKVYTSKDTFPESSAVAQTATTDGIHYTLSASNTDLEVGDWIYDASQNTARKIATVQSDTTGTLEEAFPVDLSTTTIRKVDRLDARYKVASVAADKGGNITVDGQTISQGTAIPYEIRQGQSGYLPPIVVDGSVNNATVKANR